MRAAVGRGVLRCHIMAECKTHKDSFLQYQMRLHMAIPSIVINTRVRIFSNAYTIRMPTMARKAGSYYDTSYCNRAHIGPW